MKARDLVKAYFRGNVFTGETLRKFSRELISGNIKDNKDYLQLFEPDRWRMPEPDATIITPEGATCYLYEVAA